MSSSRPTTFVARSPISWMPKLRMPSVSVSRNSPSRRWRSSRVTCDPRVPSSPMHSPAVSWSMESMSSTSVWRPPICCTSLPANSTLRVRCSPPPTTRRSTTASSCVFRELVRSVSTPACSRSRRLRARYWMAAGLHLPVGWGEPPSAICCRPSPITWCHSSIRRHFARCGWWPTPPTAWAASWCRQSSSDCRASNSR